MKVEEDAPILDVKKIVLNTLPDLFLGIGLAAPAVDLRPSRDTGLHLVAREISFDNLVVEMTFGFSLHCVQAGSDEREAASDDVDQLWQFIEPPSCE